ncbi:serine hydrolase-domain-containing protein [Phaeosphaeria sp. MPI-PUGE-AT-0046c]|nr:serine hydrolase-domain-containing protein [Phaeosphaeria sp. MPI-PUGE-AT-0046c]
MTSILGAPPAKYKALCMHGIGTNTDIFESQTAALRQQLGAQFDWDFVEGSHFWPAAKGICEIFGNHQVCYSYFDGTAQSASNAIEDLAAYVCENGPFDVLIGFSLGAAMIATLLLSSEHKKAQSYIGSVAFLCATLPSDWEELLGGRITQLRAKDVSEARKIRIPSIHAWSPDDVDYPGESIEVLRMCTPSRRVEIAHSIGHSVPFQGEELKRLTQAMVTMVTSVNLPQSQAPPAPSLHPDAISHSYVVFIGITSAMTALATASVVARFASRLRTITLWWDDWAILVSLVFAYGFLTTTVLVATVGGAGYHIVGYSLAQLEKYLKIALANNVIYNASITMSKASVLLFYRRIFYVDRWLALSINITAFVLVGYFFAAAGGLIFSNKPIVGQWDLAVPSKSINNRAFWLAMAIVNISLDVIILALPQARVWRLQLSRTRRILVSLVFLLGGL